MVWGTGDANGMMMMHSDSSTLCEVGWSDPSCWAWLITSGTGFIRISIGMNAGWMVVSMSISRFICSLKGSRPEAPDSNQSKGSLKLITILIYTPILTTPKDKVFPPLLSHKVKKTLSLFSIHFLSHNIYHTISHVWVWTLLFSLRTKSLLKDFEILRQFITGISSSIVAFFDCEWVQSIL